MGALIIVTFWSLVVGLRADHGDAGEEWLEFETWIFLVERGPGIRCTYVSVSAVLNDQQSKSSF